MKMSTFALGVVVFYALSQVSLQDKTITTVCNFEWFKFNTTVSCGPVPGSDGPGRLENLSEEIVRRLNSEPQFRNVTHLDLSFNLVQAIEPGDLNMKNLLLLNISHNRITSLRSSAFMGIKQLQTLDLSFNQLRHLYNSVFFGLDKLTHLNLAGNPIVVIEENSLSNLMSLEYLSLSSADLVCDCNMEGFHSWVHDWNNRRKKKLIVIGDPTCFTPMNISGSRLLDLSNTSLKECGRIEIPYLTVSPSETQIITKGDSLSLRCSVFYAFRHQLRVEWRHNDRDIPMSMTKIEQEFESGIMTSTVTLSNVNEKHEGKWSCLVSSVRINQNISRTLHVFGEKLWCPEFSTVTNRGEYKWPRTMAKDLSIELPCEESDNSMFTASHTCGTDGRWRSLDVSKCRFTAEFEKVLYEHARWREPGYAAYLANYLTNRNRSADTAEQLDLLLKALDNSLLLSDGNTDYNKTTQPIFKCVDWLLDSPVAIFREDTIYHLSQRVFSILRKAAGTLTLTQTMKPFNNFALTFIEYDQLSTGHFCETKKDANATEIACALGLDLNDANPVYGSSIFIPPLNTTGRSATRLMVVAFSNLKMFSALLPEEDAPSSFVIGVFPVNTEAPVILSDLLTLNIRLPQIPERPRIVSLSDSLVVQLNTCSVKTLKVERSLARVTCSKFGLVMISHSRERLISYYAGKLAVRISPVIYVTTTVAIFAHVILISIYAVYFAGISLARSYKHCLLNFWTAFVLLAVIFTLAIDQTAEKHLCQVIAVALHYLTLCSFTWILVGFHTMYKQVRKYLAENLIAQADPVVKKRPSSFGGIYLFGWGLPVIITGISAATSLPFYGNQMYCYLMIPHALMAVVAPCAVAFAISFLHFILILCQRKSQNPESPTNYLSDPASCESHAPFDFYRRFRCHAVILMFYILLLISVFISLGLWTYSAADGNVPSYSVQEILSSVLVLVFAVYPLFAFWLLNDLSKTCWGKTPKKTPHSIGNRTILPVQEPFMPPSSYQISGLEASTCGPTVSSENECFAVKHYPTPGSVSEIISGSRTYNPLSLSGRSRGQRSEEQMALNGSSRTYSPLTSERSKGQRSEEQMALNGSSRTYSPLASSERSKGQRSEEQIAFNGGLNGHYDTPKAVRTYVSRTSLRSSRPGYTSDSTKMETCM